MADPRDYRLDKKSPGALLIVRPGNKYASAREGECVLVDARELKNSSTMSACMTAEEAHELDRLREQKRIESEERRLAEYRTSLRGVVDAGLEKIMNGGTSDDARVRLGKEREAEQAAAEERRLAAIKERANAEALEADQLAAVAAAQAQAEELAEPPAKSSKKRK